MTGEEPVSAFQKRYYKESEIENARSCVEAEPSEQISGRANLHSLLTKLYCSHMVMIAVASSMVRALCKERRMTKSMPDRIQAGESHLYHRIALDLGSKIEKQELPPGGKLPGEHELARMYDVSRVTIRKALSVLEEDKLIVRSRGAGTFVARARDWRGVQTEGSGVSMIAMVFRDAAQYCSDFVPAATREAARHGLTLGLGYNATADQQRVFVENLLEAGARGILVHPNPSAFAEMHGVLERAGVPLVGFGIPPLMGIDWVCWDEAAMVNMAVDHLRSLGHRGIGYLHDASKEGNYHGAPARMCAYQEAVSSLCGAESEKWMISVDGVIMNEQDERRLDRLMGEDVRPTAFVCYNDSLAAELCDWAKARGMGVPGELSIVGIDNSREAVENGVPLTSVERGVEEMAVTAVRVLASRMEGNDRDFPEIVTIRPAQLVVRASTAALATEPVRG